MRYIHFHGNAGYCGTSYDEFQAFPDDTTDEELDEVSDSLCHDNAEQFEYLHTGWDGDFEDEADHDLYYDNAEGSWDEIPDAETFESMREDYE